MNLGKIESHGKCWFCRKECDKFWYWHKDCKKKFMDENR